MDYMIRHRLSPELFLVQTLDAGVKVIQVGVQNDAIFHKNILLIDHMFLLYHNHFLFFRGKCFL